MSAANDDTKEAIEARLDAALAENRELEEQVKLLVRTEHRLTRAQSEADRQLARVRALSTFALAYTTDEPPVAIADRAAALLREWFAVDRVATVRRSPAGGLRLAGEGVPELVPPPELVEVLGSGGAPFVWSTASVPWTAGLVMAVEGTAGPPAAAVFAGVPLGASADVLGLVCWRKPNPRASFFSEAPSEHHLPFLSLLQNHLGHALAHTRLTADLRESTRQLGDKNVRLAASLLSVEAAQARLAEAARLEAIGRLAGGIAHDFNNLLMVILANGHLLRESIPAGSPLLDDLDPIIDASERAQRLTRQLLLFARREENRPEDVHLSKVVDEFATIARRLLGEGVRVRTAHETRAPSVHIDPARLEQVLLNLATNARDAMPSGGSLVLETRRATADELRRIGAPPERRYAALVVADTGRGMDASTRARIFEPFFTSGAPGRGTGLGLAIVHSVVTEAGGHVLVDSEPGQGTRFVVLLPRPGRASTLPAPGAPHRTIFVVEDEEPIRQTLRRMLSRAGYRVIDARSGLEAEELARAGASYDLLLTDVVMPGMSGPELAATLRRSRPRLPVVFMSGHTFDTLCDHDLHAGDTLLEKPFTASDAIAVVEKALADPIATGERSEAVRPSSAPPGSS